MTENRQDAGRLGQEAKADDLTPRQRRFALEYLREPNGKQAAIAAGYSAKGAEVTASKLLRVPKVAAFIAERAAKVAQRLELDAEYVLRSLKNVAERCQQAVPVMVREGREVVQKTDERGEGIWEFDSGGANKALELLGKHLKLFTEKVEASGPGGGPLEVVIRDLSKEEE